MLTPTPPTVPAPAPVEIDFPEAGILPLDDAWWRLYESSFPIAEREPPEVIVRSVSAGVGIALRARIGGRTVGLATVHLLRDPPTVFLVYLAVDPAARRLGVGAMLFETAWQVGQDRLAADGRVATGMVWEIDASPPRAEPIPAVATDGGPSASTASVRAGTDTTAAERRGRFFAARGGIVLARDYVQPPLVESGTAVPMWLLWRPAVGTSGLSPSLASLVAAIRREKYGTANGITRTVLAALPAATPS